MSKKRAKHSNGEAIFRKKHRANDQFENLPKDILCLILSRLTLKEVVRISTLSSKWRQAGASYPKLKFDGTAMCGSSVCDKQQYTQKFIENVNAVLRWHDRMAIEDFEVKFLFHKMLVDHLKNWVSFAASSKVKNLVIDLEPENFGQCEYRYIFPFALFDKQSISHLERIQLSMVALKLPSQFIGFPNLKVLDLRILHVSANDLQRVVSSCFNLERSSINLCHLHDELRVPCPLSRLEYSCVKQSHTENSIPCKESHYFCL